EKNRSLHYIGTTCGAWVALGEDLTKEALGGVQVHARSGVIDNIAQDEADALAQIRRFLSYLPQNAWEIPARRETEDDPARTDEALRDIVPDNRRKFFDMRRAIAMIVDRDSMFEMARQYGPGQIVMLARLNGYPVGVFSNDARFHAGAMTANGARKVRRFIEFCETFNLPIVSFVDEPGFMIGSRAEQEGAIRAGTAAVLAAAVCRSPWAAVILRKSYGVAAAAHYGPGAYILGWPSAEMGALPLEGGVAVAFGHEIAAAEDPEAKRAEIEARMAATLSPAQRAESFSMHELIDPCETRPMLCEWIEWSQQRLQTQCGLSHFTIRP
ncbi:MAG: propionyl-CoA carboxylase, partial [Alphaproteobacteria bacterium]|nr:propionyl-CoA carboxylase [Alphaproteobacteria bacterium]